MAEPSRRANRGNARRPCPLDQDEEEGRHVYSVNAGLTMVAAQLVSFLMLRPSNILGSYLMHREADTLHRAAASWQGWGGAPIRAAGCQGAT